MFFKTTVVLTLFIILTSLFTVPVQAHILKTDGSIGAILHIDPEDDPIAGQVTTGLLEFKDTKNKFSLDNCNCTLTILESGNQLYSQPLTSAGSDTTAASFSYSFPQKDVYSLKVKGSALDKSFDNFELDFDVRVARAEESSQNYLVPQERAGGWLETHLIHLAGGFVVLGFFIFLLIVQAKGKKQSR